MVFGSDLLLRYEEATQAYDKKQWEDRIGQHLTGLDDRQERNYFIQSVLCSNVTKGSSFHQQMVKAFLDNIVSLDEAGELVGHVFMVNQDTYYQHAATMMFSEGLEQKYDIAMAHFKDVPVRGWSYQGANLQQQLSYLGNVKKLFDRSYDGDDALGLKKAKITYQIAPYNPDEERPTLASYNGHINFNFYLKSDDTALTQGLAYNAIVSHAHMLLSHQKELPAVDGQPGHFRIPLNRQHVVLYAPMLIDRRQAISVYGHEEWHHILHRESRAFAQGQPTAMTRDDYNLYRTSHVFYMSFEENKDCYDGNAEEISACRAENKIRNACLNDGAEIFRHVQKSTRFNHN